MASKLLGLPGRLFSHRISFLRLPVTVRIAEEQHHVRTDPRQHLRKEDPFLPEREGKQRGGAGAHDEFADAADHGQHGIAHALDAGAGHMQVVKGRQGGAHDKQVVVGDVKRFLYGRRVAGDEEAQDRPSAGDHGDEDREGSCRRDQKRGAVAVADALHPAGAQVLAGVGGHGVAVGDGGHFQQPVELVGGGVGSQEEDAEAVDQVLDDHTADRDDDILKCHRQAQTGQPRAGAAAQPQIFAGQAQDVDPAYFQIAEDPGEGLGDDGGGGRADDAVT